MVGVAPHDYVELIEDVESFSAGTRGTVLLSHSPHFHLVEVSDPTGKTSDIISCDSA